MMFAAAVDMEPGMLFRDRVGGPVLEWRGVEPVASKFAGKSRVRVLVRRGRSFVCDRDARFPLVEGGRW